MNAHWGLTWPIWLLVLVMEFRGPGVEQHTQRSEGSDNSTASASMRYRLWWLYWWGQATVQLSELGR